MNEPAQDFDGIWWVKVGKDWFRGASCSGPFWKDSEEVPKGEEKWLNFLKQNHSETYDELRSLLNKRSVGKNKSLGDLDCQLEFMSSVGEALAYINRAKKREPLAEGDTIGRLRRAADIRKAATTLLQEVERISGDEHDDQPSDLEIFEGKVGGTGLLDITKSTCKRLIERTDKMAELFSNPKGGQGRKSDMMGVKMIATAWRESFQLEPKPKGVFGEVLNTIFTKQEWAELAPGTLSKWLKGQ
jgi:hypothetical protein